MRNERYDLVVTDLGRREEGGYVTDAGQQLLASMRADNITTPVVCYTSMRGLQQRDALLSSGAMLVTARPSELIDFITDTVAG